MRRIEVENVNGFGNGGPILVYEFPDPNKMELVFDCDDIPAPQNDDFWSNCDKERVRYCTVVSYTVHPNPLVVAATIPFLMKYNTTMVVIMLTHLLCSPLSSVREKATDCLIKDGENHLPQIFEYLSGLVTGEYQDSNAPPDQAALAMTRVNYRLPLRKGLVMDTISTDT